MSISNTQTELRKSERTRIRSSANAIAFGNLCFALNDDRLSRKELRAHTGLSDGAIRSWINILRARKLIYICEYRRNHSCGQPEELFTWGYQKKDVDRPKPRTVAEQSAAYRSRKLLKETMYGISNRNNQERSSNLS